MIVTVSLYSSRFPFVCILTPRSNLLSLVMPFWTGYPMLSEIDNLTVMTTCHGLVTIVLICKFLVYPVVLCLDVP